MRAAIAVVPGSLSTLTGGSIYDKRIVEGLRQRGWTIDVVELDGAYPEPAADAIDRAATAFEHLPDDAIAIVDGLALSALPNLVAKHARRLRLVALVHMPLAEDVGIDRDTARRRKANERRSVSAASTVVVTGHQTVDVIAGYGVSRDRIVVIEPGTDPAPVARGSRGLAVQLLCVAALTPGKGHDVLLSALARVRHLDWTLTCVGSLVRHPPTLRQVQDLLRVERLDAQVTLTGELAGADLEAAYASADLFVLATLRETYGMAVAEALAHGLPVLSTTTGAIPALVGGGAGLVVEPGDAGALSDALSCVLSNPGTREQLRAGALRARNRLESWDTAVDRMAAVLEALGR